MVAVTVLLSIFSFMFFLSIENISPYKRFERVHLYAKDSLEVMSEIRAKDLVDSSPDKVPTLVEQFKNGNISDNDTSIIDTIGTFWSQGEYETAEKISRETLSLIMPNKLKYNLTIDEDEIYSSSSSSNATEVSESNKLISGFQPGKVVNGFVARAFLEKIKSKTFSSYLYFGGFVGQGNITLHMADIPSGSTATSVIMEMNLGSDFDFYVNNVFCRTIKNNGNELKVVRVETDNPKCINSILPGGQNTFSLNFTNPDISKNYVAGGFIRVDTACCDQNIDSPLIFPSRRSVINQPQLPPKYTKKTDQRESFLDPFQVSTNTYVRIPTKTEIIGGNI